MVKLRHISRMFYIKLEKNWRKKLNEVDKNNRLNDELNLLFGEFSNEVKNILGDNLKSIIIYGSVALGGFIRGKGDIDYVCITENNLKDAFK